MNWIWILCTLVLGAIAGYQVLRNQALTQIAVDLRVQLDVEVARRVAVAAALNTHVKQVHAGEYEKAIDSMTGALCLLSGKLAVSKPTEEPK